MENTVGSNGFENFEKRNSTLFQVSLLQALSNGDYCGSVTVAELKRHGDTGLGTFHRLNGELIMLDGEVYRACGDGNVEAVPESETSPFSVVTFLKTDASMALKDLYDYDELTDELNKTVEARGKNRFYMIRIDGVFKRMNVRSVPAQNEPYRRLIEVLQYGQTFFDYEGVEGTLVGIYCPPFMSYLNAVGWHLHFISKDRSKGGHVLDLSISDAVLTWCDIDLLELKLPQSERFGSFDLSIDQSAEIEKIEKNN